jgi:hypothetical protein
MKKMLVWFLLMTIINLTGCYSHKLLAPASYKFDEKMEITIITKDTMYYFKGNQYILVNDTLIGTTRYGGISLATLQPQDVRVPVEEMQLIEVTKPEGLKTSFVFLGALALFFVIVYIAAHSTAGGADLHLN